MSIQEHKISITTSGDGGSAAGSASKAVPKGTLKAVYLNYHASAPGTTDVTIKAKASASGAPPDLTILTETDNNTDGWRYPKVQKHDNSGAVITGAYDDPIIHGGIIDIAVAQADALSDCVVMYLYIEV